LFLNILNILVIIATFVFTYYCVQRTVAYAKSSRGNARVGRQRRLLLRLSSQFSTNARMCPM